MCQFVLHCAEDSNILGHIHVGQVLSIRSYSENKIEPSETLLTEIMYMKKMDDGVYAGHPTVGVMILEYDCVIHSHLVFLPTALLWSNRGGSTKYL